PGGERVDEALAMLEVLGVVTPEQATAVFMAGFPNPGEAAEWMSRTLQTIGRRLTPNPSLARDLSDLPSLASWLVEGLGWQDRLAMLVDAHDLPNFLGENVLAEVPQASRAALAYLVKEEILPRPRGSEAPSAAVRAPVSRAMVARALHR